jgi:putative transposase
VTNYRQNFICGGSFFFTANLAERRLRLLVDDIVSANDDGFRCRSTHPTGCKSATETDEAADQHNR